MKIFIIGLPKSGRSTIAKAIADSSGYQYIDAMSWIKSSFRSIKKGEHPHQYDDEYHQYLNKRMMINPSFIQDYISETMKVIGNDKSIFVIDGVSAPNTFNSLFDYRKDVVIFLNRVDGDFEFKDHENIGISVIRDYCYWLSSASLINKDKWLEYNFRIPGEDSDFIKSLGSKNSVFIVKSINNVISHLKIKLGILVNEISK